MGLKAFTEGSKKTLHQQIVLLATSLANPEVRKVCLWAIHMIVSHCPVSRYTHMPASHPARCIMVTHAVFLISPQHRFVASHSMADLTSAFHEGLVSLQPLMAEPSIFATSLRIIAEVRRPSLSRALTSHPGGVAHHNSRLEHVRPRAPATWSRRSTRSTY
jgi:hypothetical protein